MIIETSSSSWYRPSAFFNVYAKFERPSRKARASLGAFVSGQRPGRRRAIGSPTAGKRQRPLLGRHFFGFAFLAHEFELALGGFKLGVNFLLDAACRFFELR